MEHSQYRHFRSRVREEVDAEMVPTRGYDYVGCLSDQVKLTHALNEELDQAMKDIRQFDDREAEASWRITELETLHKKHGEAVEKLKKENTTLESMVQSHDELIMEIVAETRLDRIGEDDDEDDNDGGDAAAPLAAEPPPIAVPPTDAAPAATAPELVVEEEEEDSEMLIPE
jgi:predicted RNase H-like nuclease (RuvC/YqgF family)